MQAVDCTNLRMQTVPDIKHEDTVLKKEEKKDSNSTFHSFFKTENPKNKATVKVGLVGSR